MWRRSTQLLNFHIDTLLCCSATIKKLQLNNKMQCIWEIETASKRAKHEILWHFNSFHNSKKFSSWSESSTRSFKGYFPDIFTIEKQPEVICIYSYEEKLTTCNTQQSHQMMRRRDKKIINKIAYNCAGYELRTTTRFDAGFQF